MLEVSAAIITDGSNVLCFQKNLCKRSYLSYKFEFPGGKLESGETPEQALIRELKEELNFDATDLYIKPFKDLIHEYRDFSVMVHYLIVYCLDPKYTLTEHIAAVWKPVNELSQLDWADADLEAAKILETEGIE